MTSRLPGSCLLAARNVKASHLHNATLSIHIAFARHPCSVRRSIPTTSQPLSSTNIRSFSSHRPSKRYISRAPPTPSSHEHTAKARTTAQIASQSRPIVSSSEYTPKAAFEAAESGPLSDRSNPPLSCLPPPLTLPNRKDVHSTFTYLLKTGQAYGSFYKNGVKAVWFNRKARLLILGRLSDKKLESAAEKKLLSRAEYQVVARNLRDIGKLPLFTVLVMLLGEWLPLLVPYIPNAVPYVCRFPKQIEGMRSKQEERRRRAFREGVVGPHIEIPRTEKDVSSTNRGNGAAIIDGLKYEQLHHLSSTLDLHGRWWETLNVEPPRFMIARRLSQKLGYLAIDDSLLLHAGGASKLSSAELGIACEERGMDVLNRADAELQQRLDEWLRQQQKDQGLGQNIMSMLFRRPNAWK
ncbi:Hypothetical protein R9X50_00723300 [Acrodontium crateriforme]|uniref:Letm1 RBD domain-containing protein n=1 Tax=Acrodontium crateriforme TaxID=150365 RepID=A0AAQ3MAI5_9PEZI|nr:Hypothetical protein R9X50_00723300 [Acrodontium crateriforme]